MAGKLTSRLITSLKDFPKPSKPVVLTIGNFDGVHRGHQSVLSHMRKIAQTACIETCAITFSNHPSEILRPTSPILLLCNLPHRIKLLQERNIDTIVVLPFTPEIAQQSASEFIENIYSHIPFSHLILGHDATLGKDRQGDRATMHRLGETHGFVVDYVEGYSDEISPISSSRIRFFLIEGNLLKVEELLGRPYSIYGKVLPGLGRGKQIGFPTANLDVSGLCCPPYGVYAVSVKKGKSITPGIANLGLAPTIRNKPLLEVHLFTQEGDLYNQEIEVLFHSFVRPEKRFNSLDELKNQIQADIQAVQSQK